MGSFAGISELWGPSLNDFQDEVETIAKDQGLRNETHSDNDEGMKDDNDGIFGSSFGGLPWHNEKGSEGQEYRLSQMLADEEWVSESDPEGSPMTLEDYNEHVKEITDKLEEEMRETEAILLSKPGTDPVGWDYDDDQLIPMSNVTKADENEEGDDMDIKNKTTIKDADLSVLEMDVEVEDNGVIITGIDDRVDVEYEDQDDGGTNALTQNLSVNIEGENDVLRDEEFPEARSSSDQSSDDGNEVNGFDKVSFDTPTSESIDSDSSSSNNDGKTKIEPIVLDDEEDNPTTEVDTSANTSNDMDETTNNDGKMKIEPIFLEDENENSKATDAEEEDDIRL